MPNPLDAAAARRILSTTSHPGELATVTRDGAPTVVRRDGVAGKWRCRLRIDTILAEGEVGGMTVSGVG